MSKTKFNPSKLDKLIYVMQMEVISKSKKKAERELSDDPSNIHLKQYIKDLEALSSGLNQLGVNIQKPI